MRKILNGRAEKKNAERPDDFGRNRGRGNDDHTSGQTDFPLSEQCDRTLMSGMFGVLMNQDVQRRANSHRVQQQDQADQQSSNCGFAELIELSGALQSSRKLAAANKTSTAFKYSEKDSDDEQTE